jgi:hypothetical protein
VAVGVQVVEAVRRLVVGVVAVDRLARLDRLLVVTCAPPPPRSVEINPAMRQHRESILEREPEGATRTAILNHASMYAFPQVGDENIPFTETVDKKNRVVLARADKDVIFGMNGSVKVESRSIDCRVFALLLGKLVGMVLWNAES